MTNNNPNPSNPREDELDTILEVAAIYGTEYFLCSERTQKHFIKAFKHSPNYKEGIAKLKSREATMQAEWEKRPVPHTSTCEISLRWADVCDCGADVYNKNLKRAEAAQTNGEGANEHPPTNPLPYGR